MAIIKVKRSTGIAAPASLEPGEVAVTIEAGTSGTWDNKAGRLFVGNTNNVPVEIGGEYTYKLLDHQPSILTPSSAAVVGAAGTIDFWNVVGVLTASTAKLLDVYVAQSGVGSLNVGSTNQFSVSYAGTITAPTINITGLSSSSLVVTNAQNQLVTDSYLKFYQNSEVFGGLLDVSSAVSIGGTLTATTSPADFGTLSANTANINVGIVSDLTVGIGTAGNQYAFPTSREVAAGQILLADGNGQLSFATYDQTLNTIADSGTGSVGLRSEFLRILGTQYEIETVAIGNTITIGLPDDVLVGGGLTVTGNLTVNGNPSYLSSTITQIRDKNIELAVPDSGSASDALADGGGITVKGDSDYQITWSSSRGAFVVNQNWEPLNDDAFDLGSSGAQWRNLFVNGTSELDNVNIAGILTVASLNLDGGEINNARIGLGQSSDGNFARLGFGTAFGGALTASSATLTELFLPNRDTNGVAYAGTSGIIGVSSSPTAGISTSTYILTSLGGVPVYTDTIDCGTY